MPEAASLSEQRLERSRVLSVLRLEPRDVALDGLLRPLGLREGGLQRPDTLVLGAKLGVRLLLGFHVPQGLRSPRNRGTLLALADLPR